jgi:hypothetical protein
VIDGTSGGAVFANMKGKGLQLLAGNPDACDDGDVNSATISINQAIVENSDNNGSVVINACGHVSVNTDGGSTLRGDTVDVNCVLTTCTMEFLGATVIGKPKIKISADDDITIAGSSFITESPIDSIEIISRNGNVFAGSAEGGGEGVCIPEGQQFPIVIDNAQEYEEFCENNCDCERGGNSFDTGIEGNLKIQAKESIDLANACVYVAEKIQLIAETGSIDLTNAQIRNDFGKGGHIIIIANGGVGTITITDAIIIDNGDSGGGSDPNDVASMNNSSVSTPNASGTCANSPTCSFKGGVPLDIVNQNRKADRTGVPGVTGTAKCDM